MPLLGEHILINKPSPWTVQFSLFGKSCCICKQGSQPRASSEEHFSEADRWVDWWCYWSLPQLAKKLSVTNTHPLPLCKYWHLRKERWAPGMAASQGNIWNILGRRALLSSHNNIYPGVGKEEALRIWEHHQVPRKKHQPRQEKSKSWIWAPKPAEGSHQTPGPTSPFYPCKIGTKQKPLIKTWPDLGDFQNLDLNLTVWVHAYYK